MRTGRNPVLDTGGAVACFTFDLQPWALRRLACVFHYTAYTWLIEKVRDVFSLHRLRASSGSDWFIQKTVVRILRHGCCNNTTSGLIE